MMDVKDATQTVDGRPVRIYATDGGGTYPVHGAIREGKGWRMVTWTKEGRADPATVTIIDLKLTDWRDEIPWECLRDEIRWVARSEDGLWWGYSKLPKNYVYPGSGADFGLGCIKMPAGPADWKQAIAQRPEWR